MRSIPGSLANLMEEAGMLQGFRNVLFVENANDLQLCKDNGLPYIDVRGWKGGYKEAMIHIILAIVDNMDYRYQKVIRKLLGKDESMMPKPVTVRQWSPNLLHCGKHDMMEQTEVRLVPKVRNVWVNMEVLIDLNLVPTFIGTIEDAIKSNLTGEYMFQEGWNKRLDAPVGFNDCRVGQPRNLMIVDVSQTMGEVGDLMLFLLSTMRSRLSADLIVTSAESYWFDKDEELPSPTEMRAKVGRNNESEMFDDILCRRVADEIFDNIVLIGDRGRPYLADRTIQNLRRTKIGKVYCLHLDWPMAKEKPGYGLWIDDACLEHEEIEVGDWVKWSV